ncbi:DUF5691 domain-containing protein [Streptomyces mobaraensis]|uniref:Uncharacterized protein n=1 Tax=Streptomyces mobaraensis TaxID=35621 RepID=A0A5N5WIA2_STRMB|nr:DUF5691 domain-containing protein [Streptomyces mobaraensis]KAB7852791.1 hypothetical protein FRZ00_00875 [Streptomyces mobaraensis]
MNAPGHAAPPLDVPWDDLVTAALIGTGRRGAPTAARPGQDPALALLDAAALHTVRRRAAALPVAAGRRPEPAPPDPRPPLPEAARRRLALLLGERAGGGDRRRTAAPDLVELLPQWLTAANARGYRPPDALLPGLLDAARARTDLRPEALAFAGPRGRWLAGLNPQWAYALRSHPPGPGAASPVSPASSGPPDATGLDGLRRVWREGLFAERLAALTAVRGHDAAAGRELLAGTWATERAEDRQAFLGALRDGLSPDDEPFLEAALSDRGRSVRALAAELLAVLPGSALTARMTARARTCVALDQGVVVVEAPHECDDGMRRDGISAKPPSGRGARSWWLSGIVEATPLSVWPDRLGVPGAAEAVALPVADGWRPDLHAAWCRAAVRQRDAAWARALLGPPTTPPAPEGSPGRDPARLLTVLPAAERADWVARFVAAHGLSDAFRPIGVCAVPWAEPLGRAVVDALEIARDTGGYPWSFSGVMGLAERCLDPDQADRLAVLAAPAGADDAPREDAAPPGAAGYWAEAFQRLAGTLRLRAVMRAELAG